MSSDICLFIDGSCLRIFFDENMLLADNLCMLLIFFNQNYGYLGDESASSEGEETHTDTLPKSGLFPNLQV
jgi:hypothetical protein